MAASAFRLPAFGALKFLEIGSWGLVVDFLLK
jgi:hypothetical protein